MVSLVSLIAILATLVTLSRAEEVEGQNQDQLHSKRFFNWGLGGFYGGWGLGYNPWIYSWSSMYTIYGYGLFNSYLYGGGFGGFFAKATDTEKLARRAVSLDAEQLYRRDSAGTVSCVNEKGESAVFVTQDCMNAAKKMSQNKLSSSSCGSCTLSLVSPKDRMAPKNLPANLLEKSAQGILKACSQPKSAQHARRSPAVDNSNDQVAMLLSKGDNAVC